MFGYLSILGTFCLSTFLRLSQQYPRFENADCEMLVIDGFCLEPNTRPKPPDLLLHFPSYPYCLPFERVAT